MSRRRGFFATRANLLSLLEKVEAQRTLHYVRAGNHDSKSVEIIDNARSIEQLGIALVGDRNHVPSYLIVDAKTKVNTEIIQLRRGGVKYAVYQPKNPKSIAFNPGGEFGSDAIVAGDVGTVSRDTDSLALYMLISKQLRKDFVYINGYYVSNDAVEAMDSGIRLTANVRSPCEYDLQRI